MFVVTLLGAPGAGAVGPDMVQALADAWGGTMPRWLGAGEAATFDVDTAPDNQWDVWEQLQARGVDLVVHPGPARRCGMLIADMDSTMIEQECIDELADMAGFGDRVKGITARAMNGELDFEAALTERVGLLKGLPETVIDEVYAARITMASGARTLLATMRAAGGHSVLVSGGFTAFSARVAADLGFAEHRANILLAEDGRLTGDVGRPILGRDAKIVALEQIATAQGLSPEEVIAVGDGANDLGMLGRAGMGVALHAKPSVAAQCNLRINHGDLTALLYLQGYGKDEFVSG